MQPRISGSHVYNSQKMRARNVMLYQSCFGIFHVDQITADIDGGIALPCGHDRKGILSYDDPLRREFMRRECIGGRFLHC